MAIHKADFRHESAAAQDAFDRCCRFANFKLHLASPIDRVILTDRAIEVVTPNGVFHADFLIVGTGFVIDLTARPELCRIAPHIARWSDRYRPPASEENSVLGAYPYLSNYFQFTEKTPGAAPYLKNIFCYTYAAMPSLGSSAGISQLKFGVDRISFGVTRELFLDDADFYFMSLQNYREAELDTSVFEAALREPSPAAKRSISG